VRGYGLFAANIFGLHDFEPSAGKNGRLTLAPGESLRFRYRVVIHP
jgi:Methane oxygenase PmoA